MTKIKIEIPRSPNAYNPRIVECDHQEIDIQPSPCKEMNKKYKELRQNIIKDLDSDKISIEELKEKLEEEYNKIKQQYANTKNDVKDASSVMILLNKRALSFKELCKEYKKIMQDHGNNANNFKWLSDNGYNWFLLQVNMNNLSFDGFKKDASQLSDFFNYRD